VTSALRSDVSGAPGHASTVTMVNPRGMSSPVGSAVALPVKAGTTAGGHLTFHATGLPAGLSISRAGVISGTARHAGTKTVTVTATDATGATARLTFVWTTTGPPRHRR
jgi:beta-glucosidase